MLASLVDNETLQFKMEPSPRQGLTPLQFPAEELERFKRDHKAAHKVLKLVRSHALATHDYATKLDRLFRTAEDEISTTNG